MKNNTKRHESNFDNGLNSWQRERSTEELQRFIDRREALLQACIGCDEVL